MGPIIDLGHDHFLRFTAWKPDRNLNPQFDGIPDVEKCGAIIDHPHKKDGSQCSGSILFKVDGLEKVFQDRHCWTVESWEPLTLSPSIQCACGDHGFIKAGRWIPS